MGDQHVQAPLTRTQAVMGWLRNVIFYKVGRLVVAGARKTLTNDMLPKLSPANGAAECSARFEAAWQAERAMAAAKGRPASTNRLMWRFYWKKWLLSYVMALIGQLTSLVAPFLIQYFVKFAAMPPALMKDEVGWHYTATIVVAMVVGNVLNAHSQAMMVRIAIQVRSMMVTSVFRKVLRLSSTAGAEFDQGHVLTLMSNDANRLVDTFMFINLGATAPFFLIAILILLYRVLREYMFIGLAVVFVVTPINGIIAKSFTKFRGQIIACTDRRTRFETELFNGIRVVKFYAWESQFVRRILDIRAMELAVVRKMSLVRAGMVFLMQLTPTVTAMATFLSYSTSKKYAFDAGSIFSALSYFNLLRVPLMMLPFLIVIMAQNVVSMRRLQAFLESPEVDRVDETVYKHVSEPKEPYDVAVRFTDVTCKWKFVEDDVKKVMAVGDRAKKGKKGGKKGGAPAAGANEVEMKAADGAAETAAGAKDAEAKAAGAVEAADGAKAAVAAAPAAAGAAGGEAAPAVVPFSIRNVSLELPRGSLVMIIGAVGSGKSSLVSALMNEMVPEKGLIEVNGRIAYVPQSAWIINASLKNNILFERPYDEARYNKVLEAANLRSDLALLADGDNTEIGERGINLSGGQRQRVSIARAMYGIMASANNADLPELNDSDSGGTQRKGKKKKKATRTASTSHDILVLDDPLSAVDAHVAKAIFENCVIGIGRHTTRVMVTNNLSFLPLADRIVVLREGEIVEQGSYDELMGAGKYFQRVMSEFGMADEEAEPAVDEATALEPVDKEVEDLKRRLAASREQRKMRSSSDPNNKLTAEDPDHSGATPKASLVSSKQPPIPEAAAPAEIPAKAAPLAEAASESKPAAAAAVAAAAAAVPPAKGKLMTVELKESGNVSSKAYLLLAVYGGIPVAILVLLFQVLCTSSNSFGSWWLTQWTAFETPPHVPSKVLPGETSLTRNYLLIYAASGVLEAFGTVAFAMCFVILMVNVSRKIHSALVRRLSRAPMSFFDTTPIGRILNRLSADLDLIDTRLPMALQQYIVQFLNALGILCIIALVNAIMVGPLVGVAIIYYIVQRYYRFTSIELQRLESVSRSPLYAHFGQTLQGLSSVRSYGLQEQAIRENIRLTNINTRAYFMLRFGMSWMQFTLGFLGIIIMFLVCLFIILYRGTITPSIAGLTLSYSSMVTSVLMGLSRQAAETEQNMNGVERVHEYAHAVPQERPAVMPGEPVIDTVDSAALNAAAATAAAAGAVSAPPASVVMNVSSLWPPNGTVVFRNVTMRYREGLDPVLKKLSFTIHDKEKIGVVGRTGSGKSSLMNSLLRIIDIADPINEGSIFIGDDNIAAIGLDRLRRGLAIIPQEPVLFCGTLRYNIDPFNEHTDDELWNALTLSGLQSVVMNLKGRLLADVEEGGANFSVGQRQMICVARALVRHPRILLLDEATASIDLETDQLIQDTVRKHFQDCTVITIAHRLHTVLDCNRIMVLDAGEIVEFDSPFNLLNLQEEEEGGGAGAGGVPPLVSSKPSKGSLASLVRDTGKASERKLKAIAKQRESKRRQGQ